MQSLVLMGLLAGGLDDVCDQGHEAVEIVWSVIMWGNAPLVVSQWLLTA